MPWDTFVTQLLPSGQVFVGVATRNWPAPSSVLSGQLLPGTLAGRCARPALGYPNTLTLNPLPVVQPPCLG